MVNCTTGVMWRHDRDRTRTSAVRDRSAMTSLSTWDMATPTWHCDCSSTASQPHPGKADDSRSPASPEQAATIRDRLCGQNSIGYLPENDVLYAADVVQARIQQS